MVIYFGFRLVCSGKKSSMSAHSHFPFRSISEGNSVLNEEAVFVVLYILDLLVRFK